jgi:hypothetical protein
MAKMASSLADLLIDILSLLMISVLTGKENSTNVRARGNAFELRPLKHNALPRESKGGNWLWNKLHPTFWS